ncbi:GNAT family N-acetyltransferase [Cellulomonas fengjieae]|uniref:GNAT family N-acetyltransferase n=1 Tax=Cellulomonas fengjieae TaxID=2819978 RepID=A0ABS3SBS9_9CELL|nr:GNAT family N-acetyltransferase [Cellulomonas fengjieae]QVI65443.1 GNAT family N-acetyltransferase [Cellulomonas fengjieae]
MRPVPAPSLPDLVQPLRPSGIPAAAAVLAAALADDPGFVHLFPVRARRERELRAIYRMTLSDAVRYGHVFVTRLRGETTGVIALYPPGAYPMTPVRWWRQGLRIARIAVRTREHSLGLIKFGDMTSAGVPCSAWYIEALGVRPDLQRAGRGKKLMATVFSVIDEVGGPSYLETTKPDNVVYYAALGYESVRVPVPMAGASADGPWIFPMGREPVSPSL